MKPPFFTVIVTTHMRAALLERALRSVRAQTYGDHEVIVVSDVWDEAAMTAAASLLRPQDQFVKRGGAAGPSLSRNIGLDLATGDWVVFLDDDDSFAPHHLEVMKTHAIANKGRVLFSDCLLVEEDRAVPGVPKLDQRVLGFADQATDGLWVKNFIPNLALAYRRETLLGLRFDPYMDSLEDWEFLLAVCQRTSPVYVPGGGAIMHKDWGNDTIRRGSSAAAKNVNVIRDMLYAYRRRPAPTENLRDARRELLRA